MRAGRCGRMSPLFTFPSSYSRVATPRIVSFVQSCLFDDCNAFLKSTGAHEHILTAVQWLFNEAGFATERKNVTHSRGMKKADLHIKDFGLEGIRNVIST